jgi:hypothetical protein
MEFEKLKKRCKLLMIREAELTEQVEQMRAEKERDEKARIMQNVLDRGKERSKSRGKDELQPATINKTGQ